MKRPQALFFLSLPFCLVFYLAVAAPCLAQGQHNLARASQWYFGPGLGLDFSCPEPRLLSGSMGANGFKYEACAAISNWRGQVLFYANSTAIYNRQGQLMANDLVGGNSSRQGCLILPNPADSTQHFLITSGHIEDNLAAGLRYHTINMNANGGLGEVAQRDQLLVEGAGEAMAGTYIPEAGAYYVAFTRISGNQHLLQWAQATGAGVNQISTQWNTTQRVRNVDYLQFSPNSRWLALSGLSPESDDLAVVVLVRLLEGNQPLQADETFTLTDIDLGVGGMAFSPDSRYLFAHRRVSIDGGLGQAQFQVVQYDLAAGDEEAINASRRLIHTYPIDIFPGRMQLAPNGKIYWPVVNRQHLDAMELNGDTWHISRGNLDMGVAHTYLNLPAFPASYLQDASGRSIVPLANAGPDQTLCFNGVATLGGPPLQDVAYSWQPAALLSNPNSPNPTFAPTAPGTYHFRQNAEGVDDCTDFDSVTVTVRPSPSVSQIVGPATVCPGVEGVSYFAADSSQHLAIQWQVQGGSLQTITPYHIKVNWAGPSSTAAVWALASDPELPGCVGDTVRLPITIGTQLQPVIFEPVTQLCLGQHQGQAYRVLPTPGSGYTWQATGGTIVSGQGSPQVLVDWSGPGLHQLSLTETNTTQQASCEGSSATVMVEVYEDFSRLALDYISWAEADTGLLQLHWQVQETKPNSLDSTRLLFCAPPMAEPQQCILEETPLLPGTAPYALQPGSPSALGGQVLLQAFNTPCQTSLQSTPHALATCTVSIEANNALASRQFRLAFTGYQGWGPASHEVYRNTDSTGWELQTTVANVQPGEEHLEMLDGVEEGFLHQFRVRALHSNGTAISWSNVAVAPVQPRVFIPNVFTPNADGFNDTFEIGNLAIYTSPRLEVYNRYGRRVYLSEDYQNNWSGEGRATGVYYYVLHLAETGATYKGTVSILR